MNLQPINPNTDLNNNPKAVRNMRQIAQRASEVATQENLRLFSCFSYGQSMPLAVNIKPEDFTTHISLKSWLRKHGLAYNKQVMPIAFIAALARALGYGLEERFVADLITVAGFDANRQMRVSTIIFKVLRVPVKITKTNNNLKVKGKKKTELKKSSKEELSITIFDLKISLIQWYLARSTNFVPANGLRWTLYVVDPSVITFDEFMQTTPFIAINCQFTNELLVVESVSTCRYSQMGLVSDVIIHDIETLDHKVPYTRNLHKLLQQGYISLKELGVNEPTKFIANAYRNGLTWVHRNLTRAIVETNALVNEQFKKVEKDIVAAETKTLDQKKVDQVVNMAGKVYDDVRQTKNPELVAAFMGQTTQTDKYGLGLPTNFGIQYPTFGRTR